MTWETTPLAPITPLAPPQIVIGPDESRVIDEAIAALARASEIYVLGSELVEVIVDEPQTRGVARFGRQARIIPCAEARIRELMAREAGWRAPDGGGGTKPAHPPQWSVKAVMARGQWRGVRPIVAVATAPTLRQDGSILSAAGYDQDTAIYLAPSVEVRVAEAPSRDDARRAIAMLLDLICDFPAGAAGKSAWLAGVLSVVVRPAIDGPAPMVIIDASIRGAGKTMLVDVASLIAVGRPAARVIYTRDVTETRKLITSLALIGDPLVLLDNVVGELGCGALDAALTAGTWRDRILGASTMTSEIPLRIVWWASGNGVVVGADLSRRSLLVRLEPAVERPEERTGWRYPRLLDHVRAHRAELLSAALTIPRAYHVAGRPDMRLTPIGSYEHWSDLVRSALIWAGAPDPCLTIADLRAGDARTDALRAAILAWPVADGEAVTTAELITQAAPTSAWHVALAEWVPPRGSDDLPSAKALGYALRSVRGRIVAGRKIDADRDRTGTHRWRRVQVAGDAGDDGDSPPLRGYGPSTDPISERSPASPASPARDPGADDDDPAPGWRGGP